jgi:arylsulfatase A-like enzyme
MDKARSVYALLLRAPCAVAVAAIAAAGCSREPAAARPLNVLLVSLDSLRPDHLGCYGYRSRTGAPTSPHLDELARAGVVFENAVSTTSWTMPAHHALFCGRPDLAHGAISDENGPTPQRVQLAEVLSDAGYATAGFYSGPYLGPRYGFGGGFDVWENASGVEEALAERSAASAVGGAGDAPPAAENAARQLELGYHRASSARRVSDAALAWLEEQRRSRPQQPFFLFLHFFDVHYDYSPPEEGYARRFWPGGRRPRLNGDDFFESPDVRAGMDSEELAGVISYYDGEILWADEQVGRVLARLRALDLEEDTLVVAVSDHGDEFFEHGAKGHRQNLFQSTLAVALVARLPGRLPAGRRLAQRVSLVDVAPTILDLAGALAEADFRAPDGLRLEPGDLAHGMWGRSLLPLVDGRETPDRESLGFLANRWQDPEHPVDTWALWTGSKKVIVSQRYEWIANENGEKDRLRPIEREGRVFDLRSDPDEAKDLAETPDPSVEAAIARFEAVFSTEGPLFRLVTQLDAGPPPPPLAPDERSRLAELGYPAPPPRRRLPPATKLVQLLPPPPQFPRRPPR